MNVRLKLVGLGVILVLAAVAVMSLLGSKSSSYSLQLPDAAGLRSGAAVQIAGVTVGQVTKVYADGDRVGVDFHLDSSAPLTVDTRGEVKLATLLGTRFLSLTPGSGARLSPGSTIALQYASGTYTLEQFWVEHGGDLKKLDLGSLSQAVNVLSQDLNGSPSTNRAALDGLASLSDMVTARQAQLAQLLAATRSVTDEVVGQRQQVLQIMKNGDQVFQMVEDRRQAINDLLNNSRTLIVQLTALAQKTHEPMTAALANLRTILPVLVQHRDDLKATLEMADPALRLYVNSAGDGPWIGVNAPYLVFPDSYWCLKGNAAC